MTPATIPALLREIRLARPRDPAFRYKQHGAWRDLDWTAADALCRSVAKGLLASGVRAGDCVAILGQSRLEWVAADLGTVLCGGVTVGIYPTSLAHDCAYILDHAEAPVAFLENREQLDKLAPVRANLTRLRTIVLLDGPDRAEPGVLVWEDFLALGTSQSESDLDERIAAVRPDDVASIVYTSGTTGMPKGAMLTHANILFAADSARQALEITPGGVYLLFLPLAHVFARLTVHLCLLGATTIAFAEGLHKIADDMAEVHPSFVAGVPRLFEKIRDRVAAEARRAGGARAWLFDRAIAIGLRASALERSRRRVPFPLALARRIADRLVFRKVRAIFGKRLEFAISGAAPLDVRVAEFFHACGVLLLEGIGMTENSSFSHVNRRRRFKLGTVGPAGPGVEVRIAEDGEILFRGPNVMKGYFKDPEATAQAIDADGWLRSGDVGEIDADGFLRVTDRKKDILVTSGGKNIAPQRIERALASSPYVSRAMVFGDRRQYLTALIAVDADRIREWAARQGKDANGLAELSRDPAVCALLEREIERVNASLASFETVKKFRIVPGDFSLESGELTPTLKLRRRVVAEHHRALVDEMYDEPSLRDTGV